MKKLDHPNIIKLLDHGSDTEYLPSGIKNEVSYLVLELAENGCLFDQIAENGPITEAKALKYFK